VPKHIIITGTEGCVLGTLFISSEIKKLETIIININADLGILRFLQ